MAQQQGWDWGEGVTRRTRRRLVNAETWHRQPGKGTEHVAMGRKTQVTEDIGPCCAEGRDIGLLVGLPSKGASKIQLHGGRPTAIRTPSFRGAARKF